MKPILLAAALVLIPALASAQAASADKAPAKPAAAKSGTPSAKATDRSPA